MTVSQSARIILAPDHILKSRWHHDAAHQLVAASFRSRRTNQEVRPS